MYLLDIVMLVFIISCEVISLVDSAHLSVPCAMNYA